MLKNKSACGIAHPTSLIFVFPMFVLPRTIFDYLFLPRPIFARQKWPAGGGNLGDHPTFMGPFGPGQGEPIGSHLFQRDSKLRCIVREELQSR